LSHWGEEKDLWRNDTKQIGLAGEGLFGIIPLPNALFISLLFFRLVSTWIYLHQKRIFGGRGEGREMGCFARPLNSSYLSINKL